MMVPRSGALPTTPMLHMSLRRRLRRRVTFFAPLKVATTASGRGSSAATFTRATVATHISPTTGLLVKDASGVPRFEANGYLAEGARTNTILQSEAPATTWSVVRATATNNYAAAPDGTTTGGRIVEDNTAGNTHALFQNYTGTASSKQVFTAYLKAGARTWATLALENVSTGDGWQVWFNLSTGAVGSNAQIANANWTFVSASIGTAVNGYYRCTIIATAPALTALRALIFLATANGVTSYNGDGASDILCWGMQVEDNVAFASSYIPTTSAAVTRNIEGLTYPLSSFPSSLNNTGSIVCSADINAATANQYAFDWNDNRSPLYYRNASTAPSLFDNSNEQIGPSLWTSTGKLYAIGSNWGSLKSNEWISGSSGGLKTFGAFTQAAGGPTIGARGSLIAGSALWGHARNILVFSVNLPPSDMALLTSWP